MMISAKSFRSVARKPRTTIWIHGSGSCTRDGARIPVPTLPLEKWVSVGRNSLNDIALLIRALREKSGNNFQMLWNRSTAQGRQNRYTVTEY